MRKNICKTTGFSILSHLGYKLVYTDIDEFALFYDFSNSIYIELNFEGLEFSKYGSAESESYPISLDEAHAIYFIFHELGYDNFDV